MQYHLGVQSKVIKGFLNASPNEVTLPCLIAGVALIAGMGWGGGGSLLGLSLRKVEHSKVKSVVESISI